MKFAWMRFLSAPRNWVLFRNSEETYDLMTLFRESSVALVAFGRATEWPGGIRTHWRSPIFAAYSLFETFDCK